ncbi:MAG: hypothetical protein H7281_17825 [Bacteriovorax sp.]|nr:hypothetical protein [Bacteriovorax sp.]
MKKNKFNIPDRKYVHGDKKMVSMRLPKDLITVLNKLSARKGWPFTDLVVTALDQYAQHEDERKTEK